MKRNGKTSKIIEFKGQKVLLHSFSVLMKSIGKSKNTILKYERFGLLPRPMFTYDESRWYTEYELAVLADCKYRYSVPFEVYDDRKYKFFDELQKGLQRIVGFIFPESYQVEKAIVHASKAAYLSVLIQHNATAIHKFENPLQLKDWLIGKPFNSKLNKLKKSNPEAFFYCYKIYELKNKYV